MDKYEYNLKLEEIDKLVDQGDYEEAAALADTIDWRRVRNVRTLCLISEIYEAADRLDKSKEMLLRAYRKSPVGRNVLYRLVEVTTALGEYDEAMEYYSEYTQVAPHDNNSYILKYMIYKGRGSSPEELISILEEYLGQEYTERWAYELALNYRQAGQIQKCLAACDDLVLWFHSGKYVKKALDLKKQYAGLTPKQQEIYESCLQEEAQEEQLDDVDEGGQMSSVPDNGDMDGEVIAETIIAQTEKEIADIVAARTAEKETESNRDEMAEQTAGILTEETVPAEETAAAEEIIPAEETAAAEETVPTEETVPAEETAPLEETISPDAASSGAAGTVMDDSEDSLQMKLAKSVRQVISGVSRRPEMNEEDVPAAVEDRLSSIQDIPVRKEPKIKAGELSIDDVLLAMGEKDQIAEESKMASSGSGTEEEEKKHSVAEAMTDDLSQEELEALKYSDNPEKFLKNRTSLPAYTSEKETAETAEEEEAAPEKEDLTESQMEARTIRIPTEEVARAFSQGETESRSKEAETPPEAETAEEEEAAPEKGSTEKEEAVPEVESAEEKEIVPGPGAAEEEEAAVPEMESAEEKETASEPEAAEEEYFEDFLTIEPHLRGLFSGFTEVDGLEDQIANAIIQAMSNRDDRTSRSGNILIFGGPGSGKTTLAVQIAKALAQEKGNKVAKMARIYATDLNRRDIAATVAKIAGGALIIEEAGDLEDKTIEQLTTAMEFRTNGLIVILEDEQRYLHELLMNHPRFTMKFTAQIYLPEYTFKELLNFGQLYAEEQGCRISDEAAEVLAKKVSDAEQSESPVSVAGVIEMTGGAIRHSNKFFRRMFLGKRRYDAENFILLFAKDFK